MNVDPRPASGTRSSAPPDVAFEPRRLFLREPGWRIGQKSGNAREFCFMVAPGQNFYHRLHDGELFVHHGDERFCLACAERKGLLSHEPKGLRESLVTPDLEPQSSPEDEIDLEGPYRRRG